MFFLSVFVPFGAANTDTYLFYMITSKKSIFSFIQRRSAAVINRILITFAAPIRFICVRSIVWLTEHSKKKSFMEILLLESK